MNLYDIINQIILNHCNEQNEFGGNFSNYDKEEIYNEIMYAVTNYKESFFPLLTYNELENILKIAIKMPSMGIKYVAQETGLNITGLYNWTCGARHIGPQRMDVLINFIKNKRPDIIPNLYIKWRESQV